MSKLVFSIDISAGKPTPLEAQAILSRISARGCFHETMNLRLPLGIYNVSIQRVCDKLIRLCNGLENYFSKVRTIEPETPEIQSLRQEIVDYIEFALYAAAEHVDDVDAIASGFFKDKHQRNKNAAYKAFDADLKKHKKFVAAAANNIKHQQARVRLYSIEYRNGPSLGCLHGYFIEGVSNGEVGPSGIFHRDQLVFSVATLVWEVIVFLLLSSQTLARFLDSEANQFVGPIRDARGDSFAKLFSAAARLPNYTFGEEHPFSRVSLSLIAPPDDSLSSLNSGLYGSILHKWMPELGLTLGGFSFGYQGDGITTKFKIVGPKSVVLRNWGEPSPAAKAA